MNKFTKSDLRHHVTESGSHFFDRSSMKFFGDTMANYGIRSTTIQTSYDFEGKYIEHGVTLKVWELYRKRPVKHGLSDSRYFNKLTFEMVSPTSETK